MLHSFKGVKVRRVLDATDNPSPRGDHLFSWISKPSWSTPGKHRRLIDLNTCEILPQAPIGNLRMSSVDCNTPTTYDYTATVSSTYLTRICAHALDTPIPPFSCEDGIEGHIVWLHMPIDKGEYLTEIWAVRIPKFCFPALIVSNWVQMRYKNY